MKKGFTLIELLVVVLIIGILAAIALPQYEKSVEKSRLTEGLINMRAMQDVLDAHLLTNGFTYANLSDLGSDINVANSKYFYAEDGSNTGGFCASSMCRIILGRKGNKYQLNAEKFPSNPSVWVKKCWTCSTDIGKKICRSLEADGWTYEEGSY